MFRRRRQSTSESSTNHSSSTKTAAAPAATDDDEEAPTSGTRGKRPRPLSCLQLKHSVLQSRNGSPSINRISLMVASLLLFVFELWRSGRTIQIDRPTEEAFDNLQIIFSNVNSNTMRLPLRHIATRSASYGGLEFQSIGDQFVHGRRISLEDEEHEEGYRESVLDSVEKESFSSRYQADEDLQDQERSCQRTNWQSKIFPNCNEFHELTLGRPTGSGQDYAIKYLGHGHFRDAWLFDSVTSVFAYKRLRLNDEFNVDYWDMHKIHKEAIIMERLTPSPRIVNIYGHCSTTILSEPMASEVWRDIVPGTGHAKQSELGALDDVYPRNNFTVTEKLDMALEMAEALADMHGMREGVIVHGDTHPEQWLKAKDGRLVLNDFNNGEILEWNTAEKRYCRSWRKYGGFYRAPEEYTGKFIDEGIDTFAFGNNIYCLLTGLWPFYDDKSVYSVIQGKLLKGQRAYVDPRYRKRSFIESKLVQVMEMTWEHDPKKRVSMFQVVKFLRWVKEEHQKKVNLAKKPVRRSLSKYVP